MVNEQMISWIFRNLNFFMNPRRFEFHSSKLICEVKI